MRGGGGDDRFTADFLDSDELFLRKTLKECRTVFERVSPGVTDGTNFSTKPILREIG
jgi:hypothetical protein